MLVAAKNTGQFKSIIPLLVSFEGGMRTSDGATALMIAAHCSDSIDDSLIDAESGMQK